MKELFDCVAAGNVDDLEKFIDKLLLEENDETKGKTMMTFQLSEVVISQD
jgi:hypothetical protein